MICNRRNFLKGLLTFGAATVTTVAAKTHTPSATKLTTVKVAGLQYGECADHVFKHKESLQLLREPDNPYDTYAIAIYKENKKVSYIPQTNSRIIASLMDSGNRVHATVRYFKKYEAPWERVWVSVWIKS